MNKTYKQTLNNNTNKKDQNRAHKPTQAEPPIQSLDLIIGEKNKPIGESKSSVHKGA